MTVVVDPAAETNRGDDSSGDLKKRIADVLALGNKHRGLPEDHALFVAISKLEAPDYLAGADEMLASFMKADSPFGTHSAVAAEAWVGRWLEVDSAAALAFLGSSAKFKETPLGRLLSVRANSTQGAIFSVLARRQPGWTQQYLATLEPATQRDVGAYQLLKETAQLNATKARELLASFSEGPNRPAALQGYVRGLAANDVRAAFGVAVGDPPGPFRKELLEDVFRSAAERGVGTVRELLDRVEDEALRRDLTGHAALELSWRSRDDLLPWLMEEAQRTSFAATGNRQFDFWHNYVAQALTTTGDAARAADWALTLSNDPEKKLLLRLLGFWGHDQAGLRTWLSSHAEALDASVLGNLGYTIADMARRDALGTRAWAAALPPGPLRDQAQFQLALSSGAEGDLTQAASAYASLAASDTSGALAKQLATVLTKQNGLAAAEWAMAMPQGPSRAAAITSVAEQWSQRDPRGAAEWIGQMPPGAERDAAVREYARMVVYADPHAAADWVQQVVDPTVRAKAAEAVFYTWNNEDPIASRAWLRTLEGVEDKWRGDFLRKVQ